VKTVQNGVVARVDHRGDVSGWNDTGQASEEAGGADASREGCDHGFQAKRLPTACGRLR
jgi:hypothetical protein